MIVYVCWIVRGDMTQARKAYEGTCCPSADLCADYFDPVCDQFGNFYANDCIFDFHKCAQRRSGGPLIIIEGRGEQACANAIAAAAAKQQTKNNKKNNNLNNNIKRNNEEQVVNNGRLLISKPPPCHFFCDETIAPVCDSQSRTHKNRCKFELTACRINSRGIISALHIVKEGPCRIEENNFKKFPRANSVRRLAPPHNYFNNINNGDSNNQRITNSKRKLLSSFESFNVEKNDGIQKISPQWITGPAASPVNQHQLDFPPKQMFNDQVQKHQMQQGHQQCDMCRDEGPFDQIVPVCDNTNRTHKSVCLFAQWNCERRLRGEEENVFVHVGECNQVSPIFVSNEEDCPSKCSHQLRPVCDSNGITHPNLCAYKLYRCLQRKSGIKSTGWLVSLRECATTTSTSSHDHNVSNNKNTLIPSQHSKQPLKSIECPDEPNCEDEVEENKIQQICDSDGRVHKSTCLFAHAHCLAAKTGKALRIIECPPQLQNVSTTISIPTIPTSTSSQQKQISTKLVPKISANFASMPPHLTTTTSKTLINTQEEKQKILDCERRWHDCGESPKDAYCGSDLITYRNFCAIQKASCLDSQIEVLFKGECERCLSNPCLAKRNTAEEDNNDSFYVCDQGGETKSKCEFEVLRCIYEIKFGYNITAAYQGKCCPSIESCTGGPETQPICDTNNSRHSNWCSFEVAKCRSIKIHHKPLEERECSINNTERRKENIEEREEETGQQHEADVHSSAISQQLLTSSSNTDVLQNVSVELLSVDQLICSDKYEPLCASDGRTYRNGCHLERHNASVKDKNESSPLRVLYPGECCPEVKCQDNYLPVCDSEFTTHSNFCQFSHQRCLAERTTAQNLTIISLTKCDLKNDNVSSLLRKSLTNDSFNLS
uniref:Kazal-like domain-containing protein n=1 Tax=Meloidogyne enterolobii TaxID=390850 RepID=A0A6V7UTA4_MELEN|nr:unnamed protein product [Meloidogyne enterolobii]